MNSTPQKKKYVVSVFKKGSNQLIREMSYDSPYDAILFQERMAHTGNETKLSKVDGTIIEAKELLLYS